MGLLKPAPAIFFFSPTWGRGSGKSLRQAHPPPRLVLPPIPPFSCLGMLSPTSSQSNARWHLPVCHWALEPRGCLSLGAVNMLYSTFVIPGASSMCLLPVVKHIGLGSLSEIQIAHTTPNKQVSSPILLNSFHGTCWILWGHLGGPQKASSGERKQLWTSSFMALPVPAPAISQVEAYIDLWSWVGPGKGARNPPPSQPSSAHRVVFPKHSLQYVKAGYVNWPPVESMIVL